MPATQLPFSALTAPEHSLPPLDIAAAELPARLRSSARLSVLDVTEWFGDTSGGIRTYLLQKAQYVSARPWLHQVLLVPGARDAITEIDGVRMYRLQGPRIPRQKPYRFMLATRSITRIVQHERPDLIEVGSPFLVPWVVRRATRALGVPLVCFYHSNLPRVIAPLGAASQLPRRTAHHLAWRYMRRLDRIFPLTVVTSSYSANDLAAQGITRIAHVPLGVDLDRFTPERRAHAPATRARFGLPDGPLAGFIGRFSREKELLLLLDAWPSVERRTGVRLVLMGTGPLEPALRSHRYASRVTWVPFENDRDRVADVLASLDLYISAGSIETFGLSALEALASGTPVLSADRGGVSELVTRSGGGALFASGDRDALATAAEALLGADLAPLGARGRTYAEREHAWPLVFDRLFDVYREVLGR